MKCSLKLRGRSIAATCRSASCRLPTRSDPRITSTSTVQVPAIESGTDQASASRGVPRGRL